MSESLAGKPLKTKDESKGRLTLTGLEAPMRLVDDIDAALAADDSAIFMPVFQ